MANRKSVEHATTCVTYRYTECLLVDGLWNKCEVKGNLFGLISL